MSHLVIAEMIHRSCKSQFDQLFSNKNANNLKNNFFFNYEKPK